MTQKFPCHCCGYLTCSGMPSGSYDICPVCFWEDDPVQLKDEANRGGANRLSLVEARINFQKFGACEPEMVPNVRKPKPDEVPQ